MHYEKTKAIVQEEPFDVLDITSTLETIGVELSHPVYRTQNRQLVLSACSSARDGDHAPRRAVFLLAGREDGKATVSVLRLRRLPGSRTYPGDRGALDDQHRARCLDSTINSDAPDSRFVTWLNQFQWVRRLSEKRGDQIRLRADLQLTNDALLPVEQYAVGGLDSVRGYRSFQLLRDYGYTASLEYRIPVFRNQTGWRNLQFAAYVDTGGAKFKERRTPRRRASPASGSA